MESDNSLLFEPKSDGLSRKKPKFVRMVSKVLMKAEEEKIEENSKINQVTAPLHNAAWLLEPCFYSTLFAEYPGFR